MSATDHRFAVPREKQFEFDATVAGVFDDMLVRSVPQYLETLECAADLIARWTKEGGTAIDLGCSTASLLLKLHKKNPNLALIGVDSSEAMIEKAREKAAAFGAKIDFITADATELSFENIEAIGANYLLQFIRPPKRAEFVKKICGWLKEGAIFIFSEKLACEHKKLDKILIDRYYDFKRVQGYSDYEISQKREALENVLIPYSENENKAMVIQAGFSFVECVLRWNNFALFAAIK
ncbi:MAG: carboxy-S-adenosyl-L-methionine synthase CmoA [Helicobacteraceae bacterium]|jgi:tRNA (cmo5U34)-methyltransferase|nr:carboxy-S-adenosyl-L-methionine synthase CmoA [Helicobacteraceae bacterium]